MKQLPHRHHSIGSLDSPMTVDCLVTQPGDHLRFGEDGFSSGGLEAGLVNQRAEIVLIGEAKRGVMLERPGDGELKRSAGVKAGRPGVGMRGTLRTNGRLMDGRPFPLEEPEVTQAATTERALRSTLSRCRMASKIAARLSMLGFPLGESIR
jgi:hypothetical protein